jgi:hypothetical protein
LAELGRVAGEIPDRGIDLRECDLHSYSVNAAAGVGKPVFRGRSGGRACWQRADLL